MPFNPLPSSCDTSIISPILRIGKLRDSVRLKDLPKVTQPGSVRVWIQTQVGLLSKAQHPSFHGTISLSDSHTGTEKKMSPEKELDSRPSVEMGSPSVGLQWGFLPPLPPGPVPACLPLVSHSAARPKPALTTALTPGRGTLSPPSSGSLGPADGEVSEVGLGQASAGNLLPPGVETPCLNVLASSCPGGREGASSWIEKSS